MTFIVVLTDTSPFKSAYKYKSRSTDAIPTVTIGIVAILTSVFSFPVIDKLFTISPDTLTDARLSFKILSIFTSGVTLKFLTSILPFIVYP